MTFSCIWGVVNWWNLVWMLQVSSGHRHLHADAACPSTSHPLVCESSVVWILWLRPQSDSELTSPSVSQCTPGHAGVMPHIWKADHKKKPHFSVSHRLSTTQDVPAIPASDWHKKPWRILFYGTHLLPLGCQTKLIISLLSAESKISWGWDYTLFLFCI